MSCAKISWGNEEALEGSSGERKEAEVDERKRRRTERNGSNRKELWRNG